VSILILVVIGLALPVGGVFALWYWPVPRTWWSLALFVINLVIPLATGLVVAHRLRKLGWRIDARRSSQRPADDLSPPRGHHPRAT
jgi:membrane protein YdbS with pleckstrin-like domain